MEPSSERTERTEALEVNRVEIEKAQEERSTTERQEPIPINNNQDDRKDDNEEDEEDDDEDIDEESDEEGDEEELNDVFSTNVRGMTWSEWVNLENDEYSSDQDPDYATELDDNESNDETNSCASLADQEADNGESSCQAELNTLTLATILECQFCKKFISKPPIYVCEKNGHAFCQKCQTSFASENPQCNVCNEDLKGQRNWLAEKMLEALPVLRCKYEGCTFATLDQDEMEDHTGNFKSCEHRPVICNHCDELIPKWQAIYHLQLLLNHLEFD